MRVENEVAGEQMRRLLDEVAAELSAARQPVATYRLQLHKGFAFDDAARLAPYLAQLGVTDLCEVRKDGLAVEELFSTLPVALLVR